MPLSDPTAIAIETLPVFEEATQTAARFLGMPICTIGLVEDTDLVLKAAVGLSYLGFMNQLARTRRLSLTDDLISTTYHQPQYLALEDASEESLYYTSELVKAYGVRGYLGVPLHTSTGQSIGVLMALDTQPHVFTEQAIAFMEMIARWAMSEYERHVLLQRTMAQSQSETIASHLQQDAKTLGSITAPLVDKIRLHLIGQLTQELRTPLTSITGMAGMLSREIYGPLTPKQHEYAEIVRSSSQRLLETVDEILALGSLNHGQAPLVPVTVDVEMVGQQVSNTLASLAQEQNQEIHLTVEPGSRLWSLDSANLKQLMYHLLFCVLHLTGEGGTIRIHASRRDAALSLAIWLSHPWLGEGLPSMAASFQPYLSGGEQAGSLDIATPSLTATSDDADGSVVMVRSRELLALILSRHLAERQGGTLTLQGNAETGYRFVVLLPALQSLDAH
ncbi:GAF domain-containing sensor histidine kinase [Leptolyngbya sp. PCC 6406]|uniref:GAF domain-containing sensor histidine kinase n=1 Tax=Leptolyngbya sp. PCC 6406 TaxID=1173264 RepID=UPI0002ABF9A5|nr:GAF domain-containing sensor histidine kinase [Leptolyngbya sp. PCC 6406]